MRKHFLVYKYDNKLVSFQLLLKSMCNFSYYGKKPARCKKKKFRQNRCRTRVSTTVSVQEEKVNGPPAMSSNKQRRRLDAVKAERFLQFARQVNLVKKLFLVSC